eukprot:UN16406
MRSFKSVPVPRRCFAISANFSFIGSFTNENISNLTGPRRSRRVTRRKWES